MPQLIHVVQQRGKALPLIRRHAAAAGINAVDRHHGNFASNQLRQPFLAITAAHDDHAVVAAIAAIAQIAPFQRAVAADGREVVPRNLHNGLKPPRNPREQLVRPHALPLQEPQ